MVAIFAISTWLRPARRPVSQTTFLSSLSQDSLGTSLRCVMIHNHASSQRDDRDVQAGLSNKRHMAEPQAYENVRPHAAGRSIVQRLEIMCSRAQVSVLILLSVKLHDYYFDLFCMA